MTDVNSQTESRQPSVAALVFTYNESVNLPLWIKHYGSQFGEENLFIADRGSNDGSINHIGKANLIKLPRNEFDEFEKTDFISNLHSALLKFYDVVVYTDCDEFLVPDPEQHENLRDYVNAMKVDTVRAVGIDILHIINAEFPLDLTKPILSQRGFGKFGSASCKALISKQPLRWLPGFHSCDKNIAIDSSLFMFHLKFMDYSIATKRQMINLETVWSERSLAQKFGEHHRWDMEKFVHSGFQVPADIFSRGEFCEFNFDTKIAEFAEKTEFANNYFYIPMDMKKFVKIPEKFNSSI